MSLLHDESIERIRAGKIGGDGLVRMCEMLADDADLNEVPVMTLMVPFVDEGDIFIEGKYVPEIHLIVRKVDE